METCTRIYFYIAWSHSHFDPFIGIFEGKAIKLFNWGRAQRDFTYVDDIVDGILSCLSIDLEIDVFNLGNNKPVALRRFVSILEESVGKKANLSYVEAQPGDVPVTFASIEKAKKVLRFSPRTSLEEGIPKFVNWYKEVYRPLLNMSTTSLSTGVSCASRPDFYVSAGLVECHIEGGSSRIANKL